MSGLTVRVWESMVLGYPLGGVNPPPPAFPPMASPATMHGDMRTPLKHVDQHLDVGDVELVLVSRVTGVTVTITITITITVTLRWS